MAQRPIFLPSNSENNLVDSITIDFLWHPGLSKSQKQKSIRSLHESANKKTQKELSILEISSKSEKTLGVSLSAFNLMHITPDGNETSVETLFQGGKVFKKGGPFTDLYDKPSRDAKKDERLFNSGELIEFRYGDKIWPLQPKTAFYDWLYVSALYSKKLLAEKLMEYDGFSDIEFNPAKSINCQAFSAALYKSLNQRNMLEEALSSQKTFLDIYRAEKVKNVPTQINLF